MSKWEKIDHSFAVGEEIINYIKTQHITNYAEFMIFCKNNNSEWFKKMCDTPNMRKYFLN